MHKHISKHPETQHLSEDVVHYREYKILLQPDRFTSKRGFLEFWQDVEKSVKKFDLKVDIDRQGFHSQVREVLFYDTPDFDLYNALGCRSSANGRRGHSGAEHLAT